MSEFPAADSGPSPLRDRVVIVTGAGDGLGRAVAIDAAAVGATIVLVGKTVAKLEATYDAIESIGGPAPAIYPMDLIGATWADHFELIATVEKNFGRLDGLVHCAAHFPGFAPLSDEKPKDWMDGLQVNLTAPYALTRHALPLLVQSPQATIVFVTDAGDTPRPFRGAYAVAKAGIEVMAAMWTQELAQLPQLAVEIFDPGPMRTGLRRRGYPGESADGLPLPAHVAPRVTALLHRS